MPLKGVEIEVCEGITEHSSRVALKGVFSNFGDVVACWVPPIDRRGMDNASVRFAEAASAEAAKIACDAGQVFLQGMQVKVLWRTGGGRRVGNSDLGAEAGGDDARAAALKDRDGGGRGTALTDRDRGRRIRSRRRRSRSRGRRSRSRRRRGGSPMKQLAAPADGAPADPNALPAWLQGVEPPAAFSASIAESQQTPLALTGASIPPPSSFTSVPPQAAQAVAFEPEAPVDPEEVLRRKAEIEAKRKERASQMKRGPGVAALVQAALSRARVQPATGKEQPANMPGKDGRMQGPAMQPMQVDAESDEESEETMRTRKEEEARKRREEEEEENRLLREREEFLAQERAKAQEERDKQEIIRRARREKAALEAAEAERALQAREAETREQRIKASVEAAKRQQAERAAAKAAKEAADSLYDDMPQPNIESEKEQNQVRMLEAKAREKQNNLSHLPPEDRSKVIFLDVDGVLRPARAGGFDILSVDGDTATRVDTSDFFPSAMKALRHIVEKTGASVVLSSEWRRSEALCSALTDAFEKDRLRVWSGMTVSSMALEAGSDPLKSFSDRRAREITGWLGENEKVVNGWVVLDDINIAIADEAKKAKIGQLAADKSTIGPRLVQTWPLCGLTMGNAKTAVRILNGEMINKVVVERPVAPVAGGGGGGGMATPMPKAAGLVGGAASVIPGRTRLL